MLRSILISKIYADARHLLGNHPRSSGPRLPDFVFCEATSQRIQDLTAHQLQVVFRTDSEVAQSGIVKRAKNSSSEGTRAPGARNDASKAHPVSADVEDVITSQRNLTAAGAHLVRARAIYAKALVHYEEATGTLLDRNNLALSEAVDGDVHRVPVPAAQGVLHQFEAKP